MSKHKSPAKTKGKTNVKQSSKKSNLPMILTAVALVCAAVAAVAVTGSPENPGIFNNSDSSVSSVNGVEETSEIQAIVADGVLSIPIEDISSKATFYPIEVDGTEMEVLAVQASDGTIRTALNTCQSCYTSGRGYYMLEGEDLVCQNCGFHFNADQVEVQSGGCNPWPIFAQNKTETADSIEISYDFLKESAGIFANWR